ncbi:MAG: Ig domain protein group 2 domain protein, partial [Firmicutes bacterium]|nr:Ig domain protein group 2 domain protein [Bacillota bacterium]
PRSQILMKGNQIVLLPVYKARNAFVKINFDPAKGGMVNNSFSNGGTMKIGMLDTIKYNACANDGYYVSGYDHLNMNYAGNTFIDNDKERSMESWTLQVADTYIQTYFSGGYVKMAEPVADIAINPAVPNELDFSPQKNFTNLTVQYSVPFLTAKVDPKSGSKTKGAVAYFSENGEPQVGNSATPLVISPIKRNQAYILSGDPDEGYRMLWKDWTGDTNEDGVISQEEAENIKDYEGLFERKAVAGDFYNYVVNYDKPLIYYSFEPKPTGGDPGLVTGKVVLVGGNVLGNTGTAGAKTLSKPLTGVSVIINGHSLETDDNGRFTLEHQDFTTNEYHSLVINYRGINYTGYINVNFFTVIQIQEYDSFIPYNFAAFEGENKLDLRAIGNKDAEFTFRFDVTSRKSGLSAAKALVRIYSKEGVQRGTPIEVVPEAGAYIFTLNPAATGIVPGDTMTLQMVDQNGIAYLEHNVGFTFIKYLSTFSLLTSFKSPASGVIDMVGSIDAAFDLGLAGQADTYMKKNNQEWIIAFGFTKDWEKSLYDSNENEEAGDTGQESAESKLKNAAKSTDTQKVKDVAANAVDETNKEKKSANLTAGMNFGLSTSLYLRMIVDDDPNSEHYGDAYFNEMILSAKLSGSFSTKVEIQTPVGVTVFVGLEMGGDVTAMMVVEQYDYKKFYFNDNGEIDFSKAGDSDPDRDFTIYGKFMVDPYIKIMVGAEIPLATLTIDGKAAFDMNFTTTGSGSGSVTLTSSMTLKVLCFEFSWQIANKTWDLFSYGQLRSFNADQLFSDTSYLYDNAESRQITSRDYLENRGGWQGDSGSGRMKALALDSSAGNEQILQTGVYPYPYTLLADIGKNQQLLVFLDDDASNDDKNRTQLNYSINTGGSWSVPQKVDDDNTPDLLPCVYDLGDKLLVAWSSANTLINDDDTTMQVLNNNNIKASFFDKNSQTFGQVQEVTRQTQEDIYSDSNPYIAYWKDDAGQENLMIVYTKSDYRASAGESDQDAVVGDIINPYYTTLAYRFYDFDKGQWEESGENLDGYYGQNFIDASEYVEVDESNLLINESEDPAWAGYWSRVPTEDEVFIKSFANNDPLIVDSDAIGYEGYAVFAYSIDLDSDTNTNSDRELFIQLYDFDKKVFFPPIRCTDDDEGLSNLVFDQSNDNVYLYYLTAGDIHCIDVGYLINQNLLYYVVKGPGNEDQGVFVVNKIKNLYRKPEAVVTHKYDLRTDTNGNQVKENDMPIDEFMVESDDNNVYIVWGENDMTYRDGIDPNSAEAALPENNFREHQIYVARQTIGEVTETPFYQEDGVTLATYPAVDEQGETIDYSEFVDINNRVGEVQAGDPIVRRYRPMQWSEQVKLTDEKGANFNDLDFVILPDGNLRVVYVKGMSEVMDVAGMPMTVENVNNRTLMTSDFDINTEKAEVSIEPIARPQPKEVMPVIINLKNLGLVSLDNLEVELLQVCAGESQTMETQNIVKLKGGEQTSLVMSWQAPEDLTGIKLNVMVKHDGEVLGNTETVIETATAVEVTGVKTDFVDRNRLRITGFAVNNGNISATNAIIYAETGGITIGTINLGNLDVGKTQYFEFYGELQAVKFTSTVGNDGSVTDEVKLSVHADGTGESIACERYASAE